MPFQPGNKHGKGPPLLPPEVREARKFNRQELDLTLSKLMVMPPAQLQAIKTNPEATAVELALSAVLIHAINDGDEKRLDFLFNRSIGKVKENITVNGMLELRPYKELSDEELTKRIEDAQRGAALPTRTPDA